MIRRVTSVLALFSAMLVASPGAAHHVDDIPVPKNTVKLYKATADLHATAEKRRVKGLGRNYALYGRAKDGRKVHGLVREQFLNVWRQLHPGDEKEHERRERVARVTGGFPLVPGANYAHLSSIASCESGHDPRAYSSAGPYLGAWQFDQQTWESVGGTGDPRNASYAEQLYRAAKLYAQRGSAPWPVCQYN